MKTEQKQKLEKLIQTSKLLKPEEKQEWLDLLTIMNDKQASELSTILASEEVSVPPPPGKIPSQLPVSDKPLVASTNTQNLSHIRNLPRGIAQSTSTPSPSPEQNGSVTNTSIKPVKPSPSNLSNKKVVPVLPTPPSGAQTVRDKQTVPAKPEPTQAIQQSISRTTENDEPQILGSFQLESLEDVSRLTVQALRQFSPQDFEIRMKQFSNMEGYFALMSYLEDSPLYEKYIFTGLQMLKNQNLPIDYKLPMTKTEFEQIVDLLQAIQTE